MKVVIDNGFTTVTLGRDERVTVKLPGGAEVEVGSFRDPDDDDLRVDYVSVDRRGNADLAKLNRYAWGRTRRERRRG